MYDLVGETDIKQTNTNTYKIVNWGKCYRVHREGTGRERPKPEFRLTFPRKGHLGGPEVGVMQAMSEDREYARLKMGKKKKKSIPGRGNRLFKAMRWEDLVCIRDGRKAGQCACTLVSRKGSLEEKTRTRTAVEGI